MRWTRCRLAACATVLLAAACGDSGTTGKPPVDDRSAALLGTWVSTDDPSVTAVHEYLVYDPWLADLAGMSQVYRFFKVEAGKEPELVQAGGYQVSGEKLVTRPLIGLPGAAPQTFANAIYELGADRFVVESTGVPGGRRTLTRVAAFPGWPGGVATAQPVVEPTGRVELADPLPLARDQIGHLFRTGVRSAIATHAWTFDKNTSLAWSRSTDGGSGWIKNAQPALDGYMLSRARFKEQAHLRPLIFPTDTYNAYEHLWSEEAGAWEKDKLEIPRVSEGYKSADLVLSAAKGLSFVLYINEQQVDIRRRILPDTRIQTIKTPAQAVTGQWVPTDGPHGTLYVLVLTGADPALTLYVHEDGGGTGKEFPASGFDKPAAEIRPACGSAPCQVSAIERYFIVKGVHHIIALATLEGYTRRHPLEPEPRLALHLHGTPATGFATEILNVRTAAGKRELLGTLVDVDFPQGFAGEPDQIFATLQDDACLRLLASPAGTVAWRSLAVVPTFERPLGGAALVWSAEKLGLLSAAPGFVYLELKPLADESRCPTPRVLGQ